MTPSPPITVAWLTLAPVKGLALRVVDEVTVEWTGARGDRLFHLIDEDGRLVNRKQVPALAGIEAETDAEGRLLTLRFPDGGVHAGEPSLGEEVTTSFYGRPVAGRVVAGPWAELLTRHTGRALRMVRADHGQAYDRGPGGAVSLLSVASVDRLAAETATAASVDPRRFRMLIGVAGASAHAEDSWLGREVEIGTAVVRPLAHCGRCAVTTQDPDTGEVTLDTLRILRDYRGDVEADEPLPFGVWGEVVTPGRVRLGDPVRVS